MDNGDHFGVSALDRILQRLGVHGRSPICIDADQFSADAIDDIGHARPEHAVDTDDDFITRFDQVDKTGFHAGAARPRYRNRQLVFRLKQKPEQFLNLVHDGQKSKGPDARCRGPPSACRVLAGTSLDRGPSEADPPG